MSSPTLYIEFDDSSFFIATLVKKGGLFTVHHEATTPLRHTEIHTGIIFNPSRLYQLVKSYLHKHKLTSALSIISFPSSTFTTLAYKEAYLLQLILCFCKSSITIHSMISYSLVKKEGIMKIDRTIPHKEVTGQLDFFKLFSTQQSPAHLTWWIALTALAIALLSTSLLVIHKHKAKQLALLTKNEHNLMHDNEKLKEKSFYHAWQVAIRRVIFYHNWAVFYRIFFRKVTS